jgi:hypothetical protein
MGNIPATVAEETRRATGATAALTAMLLLAAVRRKTIVYRCLCSRCLTRLTVHSTQDRLGGTNLSGANPQMRSTPLS